MSSDFDNGWHSSEPRLSLAWTLRIIITFLAIAIRVYCKSFRRKPIWWDDISIVLAFVTSTTAAGVLLWGRQQGGSHVPLAELIKEGKYSKQSDFLLAEFIAALLNFVTLSLVRISILLFYSTIFGAEPWFPLWAWGLGIFSAIWLIAAEFGLIFNCSPVNYYWYRLQEGHCNNALLYYLITVIIELLLDVAIFALPIRPVIKLQVPFRTRLSILGIFLVGAFAIITNILRLYYTYQHNGKYADLYKVPLWMSIHITVAILCACLPLYRPFVTRVSEVASGMSRYAISLLSIGRRSSRGSNDSGSHNGRPDSANGTGDVHSQVGMSGDPGQTESATDIRLNSKGYTHVTEVITNKQLRQIDAAPKPSVIV